MSDLVALALFLLAVSDSGKAQAPSPAPLSKSPDLSPSSSPPHVPSESPTQTPQMATPSIAAGAGTPQLSEPSYPSTPALNASVDVIQTLPVSSASPESALLRLRNSVSPPSSALAGWVPGNGLSPLNRHAELGSNLKNQLGIVWKVLAALAALGI